MKPISQPMDEAQFWRIIEDTVSFDSEEKRLREIATRLKTLAPLDALSFRLRTDELLHRSYGSDLWCAAYLLCGGCSDDGFEYFRCWLIGQGREVFENACRNPDSLTEIVDPADEYEFELLWYVALEVFEQLTGEEGYDYIDDAFETREGNYPIFEFTWRDDDPDSMRALCPKLFERTMM